MSHTKLYGVTLH